MYECFSAYDGFGLPADTAEPRYHFVEDQQDVVLCADLLDPESEKSQRVGEELERKRNRVGKRVEENQRDVVLCADLLDTEGCSRSQLEKS